MRGWFHSSIASMTLVWYTADDPALIMWTFEIAQRNISSVGKNSSFSEQQNMFPWFVFLVKNMISVFLLWLKIIFICLE